MMYGFTASSVYVLSLGYSLEDQAWVSDLLLVLDGDVLAGELFTSAFAL